MPIVEPEVTLGNGDYSIEETAYWCGPGPEAHTGTAGHAALSLLCSRAPDAAQECACPSFAQHASPVLPVSRSERVYSHVFRLLNEYGVVLEGILLKPNMCLPGGSLGSDEAPFQGMNESPTCACPVRGGRGGRSKGKECPTCAFRMVGREARKAGRPAQAYG